MYSWLFILRLCFAVIVWQPPHDDDSFATSTRQWQADREQKLRSENGWLALVGRYPLKEGANSFGVGRHNDVILPESLKEIGPDPLGVIMVSSLTGTAKLRLADGVSMQSEGKEFQGDRFFDLGSQRRDWVSLGRMSMHVISREGRYFLRVADNETESRTKFEGCTWYPPSVGWRIEAKYIQYDTEKVLQIHNVLGELLEQPNCGYAEFRVEGVTYRLDAIREGEGLFFVFRDATAGETTYGGGRFIDIEACPRNEEKFILDFNRAYNPPCAFSKYTTCPLPPPQNVLPFRIEAGETIDFNP